MPTQYSKILDGCSTSYIALSEIEECHLEPAVDVNRRGRAALLIKKEDRSGAPAFVPDNHCAAAARVRRAAGE